MSELDDFVETCYSASLPKFNTIFKSQRIPNDLRIQELGEWLKKLSQAGVLPDYGTGAFGNLSFRLEKGTRQKALGTSEARGMNSFIITASGLKSSEPENFVKVLHGDCASFSVEVEGVKKPSSESLLHLAIYQARPDINVIFHGHNDYLLKAAADLGLSCTSKEEPFGSLELIDRVLEIISQNNFLIMKNHGFLSLGKTLDDAGSQILKFIG